MSNNILVVGGTGYIGSSVIQKIPASYSTYYTGTAKKSEDPFYQYLDYRDAESIMNVLKGRKYSKIIILSSIVEIYNSSILDFSSKMFDTNCFLFKNFLEALIKYQKSAGVVYLSSMTVYDINASVPVKECNTLNPCHNYGFTKMLAEKIFMFYMSTRSIKSFILRIPGIYGGNRKNGYIYNNLMKLKNNEDIFLDFPNRTFWETLNIDDFIKMFLTLFTKVDWSETGLDIVNICYGEETDLIKTIYFMKSKISSCTSSIYINKQCYIRFFLDNSKLSQYIDTSKYSYFSTLERYVEDAL